MLSDILLNAFNDPMNNVAMPLLDSLLSFDGAALAVGSGLVLYSTTSLFKFMSGGKKGWMSGYEAWKAGLYGDPKKGIVLGRYHGKLICYEGSNHIGIDGTTGTGKTAGAFLAALLSNLFHGWFVNDQSGELFRLTSGRRSTYGPVYQLNPGLANTDCYNPFDDIPDDDRIIANLTSLFEPLFSGSGDDQKKTGGDPHWQQAAKGILPFIALQLLYGDDPSKKHIGAILEYIADDETCFQDMAANPRHPKCHQIGLQMLADNKPHRSSVMSFIKTTLALWRDDSIVRMTSTSSFRIEELATSAEGPTTVYLTAPATSIKRMLPFYVVMEEMLKIHLMNNVKTTLSGKQKVRGVIISDDEAQNTKRPNIDSLEIERKFGIKHMLGYQSINAMADLYGEPKLELIKTKLSFRPTVGSKVVDRIVAMSGTYRKKVISHSENRSSGKPGSRGTSWKIEDAPRLTKGELENEWPEFGRALLTHPGRPAVLSTFDSERDPEFSKLIIPPHVMGSPTVIKSHWATISRPVMQRSRQERAEDNDTEETSTEQTYGGRMMQAMDALMIGITPAQPKESDDGTSEVMAEQPVVSNQRKAKVSV